MSCAVMNTRTHRPPRAPGHRQRGMATLVVVMVLFFIVAMVAAYTSRNMIFEQRASANQYRATQALEAAEAGAQWALTMLNAGRIDDACQPVAALTSSSFAARYIRVTDEARRVTLNTRTDLSPLMPTCVFNPTGNAWACNCPTDSAPPAVAATNDTRPFFRIQFKPVLVPGTVLPSPRADVFIISSVGCTRADSSCQAADADAAGAVGPAAPDGDAIATVRTKVTLRSALATQPGAAITAAQGVDGGGGTLTARNNELGDAVLGNTSGVTVIAGGAVNNVVFQSLPGTPGNTSFRSNDPSLGAQLGSVDRTLQVPPHTANDRMFSLVFGMWPQTYLQQPSVIQVNCAATCNAAQIDALAARYPGHALWLNGNLNVNGDIGSAPSVTPPATQTLLDSEVPANGPVLLIVNGAVAMTSGTVSGLIYRRATAAVPDAALGAGNTVLNGAFVTEGGLVSAGNQTVNYNAAVLNRLHTRVGTYVRLPGAWRDF
jgi:Tfp pilus assembly protein PilX